jgi:hypothetical protein
MHEKVQVLVAADWTWRTLTPIDTQRNTQNENQGEIQELCALCFSTPLGYV